MSTPVRITHIEDTTTNLNTDKRSQMWGFDTTKDIVIYYKNDLTLRHIVTADSANNIIQTLGDVIIGSTKIFGLGNTASNKGRILFTDDTNDLIQIKDAYLISDGRLGVGTSTPQTIVDVRGESGCTIPALSADTVSVFAKNNGAGQDCSVAILSRTDAQASLFLGTDVDEDVMRIVGDHSSGTMDFYVAATAYMSLNASGVFPVNNATIHAASSVGASPPTSVSTGALWYDTTANALKVYDAGWNLV